MARRKKQAIQPWVAPAGTEPKNFARMYDTTLKHPAYIKLPYSAQHLFTCMLQASAGKREFHLTEGEYKPYGFSPETFHNAKDRLIEACFIRVVRSGRTTRTPSIYAFRDCNEWRVIERVRKRNNNNLALRKTESIDTQKN